MQKVENRLRGKSREDENLRFLKEFERLVNNEGLEIKNTNKPFIEIVIGPKSDSAEWLPTNDRTNRELLSINPFCGNYCEVKSRRNFYEFESFKENDPLDFFLKINSCGYFHLVQPIVHDEEYWLAYIFHQIVDMVLYSATIMKQKKVDGKQSVVIYLKNVRGLEIRTDQHFRHFKYSFPNTPLEPFTAEFNPSNNWKDVGMTLKKIFAELSLELSFEITDDEIEKRVYEILKSNFYVRQNYNYIGAYLHLYLNAININDFGLCANQSKGQIS